MDRVVLLLLPTLAMGCLSSDVTFGDGGSDDGADAGADAGADEGSGGSATADSTDTTSSGSASVGPGTTNSSETTGPQGECESTPLRLATFNIEGVSAPGSDPFVGLAATLARIGADVVCMQEVVEGEEGWLDELAAQSGYDTVIRADFSPPIGGDIFNACMGRVPLELIASYTGSSLSSDPDANELGRDILAVRAEPAPGCFAAILAVHLKSGGDYEDLFRREVEAERLARGARLYRENNPSDAVIVLGDFNEQLDDDALGTTLDEIPSTLPASYRLGKDITIPLLYHPFALLTEQGFQLAEAFQEDSTVNDTFIGGSFTSQIDYIFFGQALLEGAEVYNGCADNGTDDDPPGGWLPKSGPPLSCTSSQIASDHLPVFADFTLP